VEYIDGRRMDTVLFTNCTLMTDEVAEKLFNHNVSVIGKLNSFDALIQDYLANRIGTFNSIMAGLEALMRVGFNKTKPTRLGVESIICNQNIEDIPRIWVWCRERNIYPFMELMNIRGRALMQEMDVTPEQAETLFNKVLEIDQLQFGYTWFPSPPFIGYHCQKYYYGIYIDSQGWVQPCSGAGMHLGNIRNNSLREIMGKGIFRKTQNIGEYLEGKCGNCPHNKKCYGCRGYTYSTSGNIFGEDDRCWHCN
jgi:radical SAM protein with 4Fe4S-binding SPASM domain